MKILLDECVDGRLALALTGHEAATTHEMGWDGVENGDLLKRAAAGFDVFLTVDRNLSFQQPTAKFGIAVIVMRVRSNRLADLMPLVPVVLSALQRIRKGEISWVG